MTSDNINRDSPITVIKQIAANLIVGIEKGIYKKNDKLLSINNYSKQHSVPRDTVERAYKKVIEKGYVNAVKGKGYYVVGMPDFKIKVLFILYATGASQETVHESIMKSMGDNVKIDIGFYQNDVDRFDDIIAANLGKYDYFMVSPDITSIDFSNVLAPKIAASSPSIANLINS